MTGSQGEFGRSKQQLGMHDAMPRRIAVGQRRTDRSCLRSLPSITALLAALLALSNA
jgi:hypothetical protein